MKKKNLLCLLSLLLCSCTEIKFNQFSSNSSDFLSSTDTSINSSSNEASASSSKDIYNTSGESSVSSSSSSSFNMTSSSKESSSNSVESSHLTPSEEKKEILKNADLNSLESWTIFSNAGCSLKSLSNGNNSITFEVNNSASNDNWNPQFLQNGLSLLENETYHASFKIKSTITRKINFLLQTSDYSDTPINEIFSLTANELFTFEKEIKITRETTYLYGFMLGKVDNDVCPISHQITISNPSLKGNGKEELESRPLDGTTSEPPSTLKGYTLRWNDEFNGNDLDQTKWSYEIGTGDWGWGNNESQYYTNRKENLYVDNGSMKIVAKKESYGGKEYTSSRIITKNKYEFHYGYIEARIALPSSMGIWPAFWLLGENIDQVNWPECGEIDVMEAINNESKVHATLHWNNNGHQSYSNQGSDLKNREEYHLYGMEWKENFVKIYVDNVMTFELNNIAPAFKKDFYFLFNVAVGGQWPGYNINNSAFPLYMSVDYLRVYQ